MVSTKIQRFGRGGKLLRAPLGSEITDDMVRAFTPSVFAEHAHESRSDAFRYIPTVNLLGEMRKAGFALTEVRQGGSKDDSKRGFTKHMLRFRNNINALSVGDTFPEVILINAHDGTSSYQIMSGLFRLVCSNGLIIASSTMDEVRIGHRGKHVMDDVIEASYRVVNDAQEQFPAIEDMRQLQLSEPEVTAFGRSAALLRFDEEAFEHNTHLPSQITRAIRREDAPNTLWNVFNRAQESLLRGGFRTTNVNENGHRSARRTREVAGIDGNVKLNRALWTLAEEMRQLKHAA